MKDQLEAAGYMVHDDRKKMFEPLMRYCDKKGLDFSETSKQWMYMYHDREGNHFYKNAESRNYLALSGSGRDLNSISGKFLSIIDAIGKKEMQIDHRSERLID